MVLLKTTKQFLSIVLKSIQSKLKLRQLVQHLEIKEKTSM